MLGNPSSIAELLVEHNCQPLWDRYRNLVSREPISTNRSLHWSWQSMQPLIEKAIIATQPEDAERRVLLLTHPDFHGRAATTNNILSGLQILQPGEFAPPHRHTLGALRFVIQGQGAVTSVDGTKCPMSKGDLIVTPSWRWHEHINQGRERLVWFDCLDLPLVQHLSTIFFEPGNASNQGTALDAMPSSDFRVEWLTAKASLLDRAALPDGTKKFDYAQTSLPALGCQLLHLPENFPINAYRTTSSAVMVIAEGEGTSTIGDVQHHWQANDVISVPHWQWVAHKASKEAIVFMVTDEPLLNKLGYLRQEFR